MLNSFRAKIYKKKWLSDCVKDKQAHRGASLPKKMALDMCSRCINAAGQRDDWWKREPINQV